MANRSEPHIRQLRSHVSDSIPSALQGWGRLVGNPGWSTLAKSQDFSSQGTATSNLHRKYFYNFNEQRI